MRGALASAMLLHQNPGKLSRADDLRTFERSKREVALVAGDQVVCARLPGTFQEPVIILIQRGTDAPGRMHEGGRADEILEEHRNRLWVQVKFRPVQHLRVLLEDRRGIKKPHLVA